MLENELEKRIQNKSKLEEEKKLLGGAIYRVRHSLPNLIVNDDNFEIFIKDLRQIDKVCSQFGEDIVRLHADLHVAYEMHLEQNQESHINTIISEIAIPLCAKIHLAQYQARELLSFISKCEEDGVHDSANITGDDYCFIILMLHELFMIYTSLITLLLSKNYIDNNYIDAIRDRLFFMIHPEYELLRKKFNVVESIKISTMQEELITTIH